MDMNVNIEGTGSAEEVEEKIVLPPMPDGAEEYGVKPRNPLEDLVDSSIESIPSDNLADPATTMYEVSDVDDGTAPPEPTKQAAIDESKVVVDPNPVIAPDAKEFVPKTQSALDDVDDEGGASKVKIAGATGLTQSDRIIVPQTDPQKFSQQTEFNPGTIQNAMGDNEVEGGIVANKTTGLVDQEREKEGFQIKEAKEDDTKDKFRVYGFAVQYEGADKTMVTRQVSDYFPDLDTATVSVNGGKYLMPKADGSFSVVHIVSGVPEIAFNDQRMYRFDDHVWKPM